MPRPKIYRSNAQKQAAYRQRKRRRQPVYFWHKSDEWETPAQLFAELDREFGFTLDVAAIPDNAKCASYFTPGVNSLTRKWEGVCFMNPPYGERPASLGEESLRQRETRRDGRLPAARSHRRGLVS